ncbi:MAG: Holliday junction branch migration protein RuvA [Paludibacteraceae bacterium]|nr:Holliday junction branch migration protein RuvA [Paludibacteraceae bacterium]MBR6041937.1 Holliday junction branch migration protein RuvA [Paludibacteraceae bacterium]MCR5568553.1 Holliday junction branch migration protein RuvA [Paludibacteraceae bacterium]
MYEYISGKISELTPTYAVVEANSVGYMVHITLNSYSALEGKAEAKLFIEEIIREDAFILYGFSDVSERVLFRQLMSVSGVGANTASVILSSFSVPELQQVIANGDVNAIKKVKGIGLKTAQRLIIDLKDKVVPSAAGGTIPFANPRNEDRSEAIAALSMLGYTAADAAALVDKVLAAQPDLPLNKLVKEALRLNK